MAEDKYDTKLSDEEEAQFQAYAKKSGRENDTVDYDLRGWWKENAGKEEDGGHLTDKHKKPNHPTFSKESKYHGVDGLEGGEWSGDEKAGYRFKPSKTNLKNMSAEDLQAYFDKVEPGVKLDLPAKAAKKRSPLYDNPRSP